MTKRGRQILITPSTAKLDTLINLDKPTTRRECQVVIGMVNQSQSWVPELSLKVRGLRKFTGTNTRFQWTPDLDKEWEGMKKSNKGGSGIMTIGHESAVACTYRCSPIYRNGLHTLPTTPRR